MQSLEDTVVLFGKYQICRVIGRGRSGTVFLARHLGLDEFRAIKRVPREDTEFYREAAVLKDLRHPGIPIIYDLEEDANYYYLIEEYLEGESLSALVEREGRLKRAEVISFGMELCRIISYLHLFKPNPILYLDLQPNNILICRGTLKLIDFDQAVTSRMAKTQLRRYGTPGFAAPEQYTGEPLDERTDIYAIGILLYYMGTGHLPQGGEDEAEHRAERGAGPNVWPEYACFSEQESKELGGELAALIVGCLCRRKEERCRSAAQVLEDLLKLKSGVFAENQIPLLRVAVAGSRHGMGVTHVSLSVVSYLSGNGFHCLYREQNESGAVRKAAHFLGGSPDEYGIFHIEGWAMKPEYGQCVMLEQPPYDAVVDDFGTGLQPVLDEDYDLVLLVCGAGWWERDDSFDSIRFLAQNKNLRVLFNHVSQNKKMIFPGDIAKIKFYRLPLFPLTGKTEFMDHFWKEVTAGTKGGKIAEKLRAERKPTAGRGPFTWELLRKLPGCFAGSGRFWKNRRN